MKLLHPSRAIAASCFIVSLVSSAAADTFVLPHILEQNGVVVGIAWNVTGGQPAVVGQNAVGQPTLGNQTMGATFSLYDNSPIYGLFSDAIAGNIHTGVFTFYPVPPNLNNDTPPIYNIELEARTLTLPACDAFTKDPSGAQASFRFVRLVPLAPVPRPGLRYAPREQKHWIPSNYRLSINGKPVPRALSVGSISLGLTYGDANNDGKPDVTVDSSDITFTLPSSDAGQFNDAFKLTQAGQPVLLPLELDYLDGNGNPLVVLTENVVVLSVGPQYAFEPVDPQTTVQVVCEKKGLNAVNVKKV